MTYQDQLPATIPLRDSYNNTVSAASDLFANWGCIAVTSCTLGDAATKAGLTITEGTNKDWPITVPNKAAGIATATYKVACSQMVSKTATPVTASFSFTLSKCAPLIVSKTVAASAVTYSFAGQAPASGKSFNSVVKNFEGLFYVNLACPASSSAPQAAGTSTCALSGVSVTEPASALITSGTDVAKATTFNLYNGNQFGYEAQLQLKTC